MENNNKVPITRLNKFFSELDFGFNLSLGQEYLHGDVNMKLILYRVDREKTSIDNVYGEVGEDKIKFLPPVEFNALVKIEGPKNRTYENGILRYNEPGLLTLHVYKHHLEELKIDIRYGDYIGWLETESKIRYYTVIDDGRVNNDNKHTMFGFKPYYNTIICAPAQEKEFKGI